jgi:HD-GYP domain-containing protein (c-di-GMP phosphodiesterase class II)
LGTIIHDAGPRAIRTYEPATTEAAWDILERFGLALQQCDQSTQQIRLTLEAAREALEADAVFWHPGGTGDMPTAVGTADVAPSWREAFLDYILRDVPDSQSGAYRSFLDPAAKPMNPWPCSVALARVSRSRGSWVVALSFHPRRLFGPADVKVLQLMRRFVLNHRQQQQVYAKLKDSMFGLVRCLTSAIDAKDPYTWGHSERVARMAVRLGQQTGMPPAALSDLYLAGLLHDIGKIGIRDSVLQKPGRLTPEEFAHIQEHPVIGDRLVSNIKPLSHLRPGVRNHHERWDGRGYPDGLAGDAIPLQARVLAVADSCDAMMATRPYRPALPPERIDAVMIEGAGSQWDPHLIEQFMACRHELYLIYQRGLGESVLAAVERVLDSGTDEFHSIRAQCAVAS